MSVALWIAGVILALAWFSRIVDAGLGMPSVANIADEKWSSVLPEWPKVSIIVPALNEEETIVEALTRLLNLDYPNYPCKDEVKSLQTTLGFQTWQDPAKH